MKMTKTKLALRTAWRRLIGDTEGQDLIEYALLAATLALGALTAIQGVATAINTEFTNIGTSITGGS